MRIVIGAFAMLLLAGCSSPSMTEMRASGPVKSYSSTKPETELSKCVLFAWQDTSLAGGNAQAHLQPGRSGGSTVYTQGNEYFADLIQKKGLTNVMYYEVGDTWISRKLRPALERCL